MLKRLTSANTLWIGLVLLVLVATFGAIRPDAIFQVTTLQFLLAETAVLLVLSVGMTFVIITSGIDLSVGSVLVFASVSTAMAMNSVSGGDATNAGWGVIAFGLLVAVVSGAVWGLLNGLLISRAKIPPLIVTLGSFGAAQGAALLLNNGSNVSGIPDKLNTHLRFRHVLRHSEHRDRGRDRHRSRRVVVVAPRGSAATRTRSVRTRRRPGASASRCAAT